MSLLKDLEEAKLYGLESDNIERSAYAGHAFESEMIAIDQIVSIMDIGTEGEIYTDLELAPIVSAYTAGVEGEEVVDFFTEFEGFGMEKVTEKIKAAGNKTKAFIKKLGKIIVGFVKRMINVAVNKNLALKKYGKVIAALVTKLTDKNFKDGEKKVKVNDLDGLAALVDEATAISGNSVKSATDAIRKSKSWNALFNLVMGDLNWLANVKDTKDMSADKIETLVKSKEILTMFDETIKSCTPSEKEITATEAKTKLLGLAKTIEGKLNDDVKVQGNLREYASVLDSQVDSLTKSDSLEGYEEGDSKNEATEQYKVLQKMGSVVSQSQAAHTKLFKHTSKCLGTLVADMRKTYSA